MSVQLVVLAIDCVSTDKTGLKADKDGYQFGGTLEETLQFNSVLVGVVLAAMRVVIVTRVARVVVARQCASHMECVA